jgi:hypothetical protein
MSNTTETAARISPTPHERSELSRAATAFYARGANPEGHLCSVVCALADVPLSQFDAAMAAYRAWLVFDLPKGGA